MKTFAALNAEGRALLDCANKLEAVLTASLPDAPPQGQATPLTRGDGD